MNVFPCAEILTVQLSIYNVHMYQCFFKLLVLIVHFMHSDFFEGKHNFNSSLQAEESWSELKI